MKRRVRGLFLPFYINLDLVNLQYITNVLNISYETFHSVIYYFNV